jgi:hypothetical protein
MDSNLYQSQTRKQLERPAYREAVPMSITIPAFFATDKQPVNGVSCVDNYTARVNLSPGFIVPPRQTVHLVQASIPYTYPNIGNAGVIPDFPAGNNRITIIFDVPTVDDNYILATGLYSYTDVMFSLNLLAVTEGWATTGTDLFTLIADVATQKIIFSVNPAAIAGGAFPAGGMTISFVNPTPAPPPAINDSVGPILGFPTSGVGSVITIPGGSTAISNTLAPSPGNFALMSSYSIWMDCVRGSYIGGVSGQLLYTFSLGDGAPNSVLSYVIPLKFPVPVTPSNYTSFNVWLTDQAGNKLILSYFQAPITFAIIFSQSPLDGTA